MKNKYNEMLYKYCAEVKTVHKSKEYSFLDKTESQHLEEAVAYTDTYPDKNYHLFLKEYDENSIQLVYEYNDFMTKETLSEKVGKDLKLISDCIYATSPKVRTHLRPDRRFMFIKDKTEIII